MYRQSPQVSPKESTPPGAFPRGQPPEPKQSDRLSTYRSSPTILNPASVPPPPASSSTKPCSATPLRRSTTRARRQRRHPRERVTRRRRTGGVDARCRPELCYVRHEAAQRRRGVYVLAQHVGFVIVDVQATGAFTLHKGRLALRRCTSTPRSRLSARSAARSPHPGCVPSRRAEVPPPEPEPGRGWGREGVSRLLPRYDGVGGCGGALGDVLIAECDRLGVVVVSPRGARSASVCLELTRPAVGGSLGE
ncbi:hypothetical protein F4775DRAFT_591144 [Biscogniauxia sp. FL1348]|nr:hypothetical protein F4775DRAFT_591144 [Biscogniauxia sp. FL1348]